MIDEIKLTKNLIKINESWKELVLLYEKKLTNIKLNQNIIENLNKFNFIKFSYSF